MKKDPLSLLHHAKHWGMKLIGAPSKTTKERTLEVYRNSSEGAFLVGRLSCEKGVYVFRYDQHYEGDPISAFPDMSGEHRSKHLWPFFSIRIPPFDRQDMREEIERLSLTEDQTIEILGSIARVSVSNPYEFRLV